MNALTRRLANALREAYSYALEGSKPLVESTRSFNCDLSREALAEFDTQEAARPLTFETDGQMAHHLLGMADRFMADWREDADDCGGPEDAELVEREAEWAQWRPRIIACVNALSGVDIALLERGNREEIAAELLALHKGSDKVSA
jgi:hypothetical protein